MNKKVKILALLVMLGMSGCTQLEPEPMYVEGERVVSCDSCAQEEVVKKCPKKTGVINYVDKCAGSCGFPVTVRRASDCK